MHRHHHHRRLILFLVAALTLGATAHAQTTAGVVVDKTGWWNNAKIRENTPVAPIEVDIPTGVPEGRLPVGATPAGTLAISAIGIQPEANPGATIDRFVLTIAEDPDAPGNQGTAVPSTIIGACPITAFWAGGENQDFEFIPDFDCAPANAVGERSDDGTWTFDLAEIGALWLDPFGTIRADGIVLIPSPDSAGGFQAVFDPSTISVTLEARGGTEPEDPFAVPTATTSTTVPADAGFASPGIPGGGGPIIARPTIPPASPPTTLTPPTTAAPVGDTGEPDDVAAPPTVPESPSQIGNIAGNLPGLLVPGIIVIALVLLAMSYYLGPAGQPVLNIRQRGVSRALELQARRAKESS